MKCRACTEGWKNFKKGHFPFCERSQKKKKKAPPSTGSSNPSAPFSGHNMPKPGEAAARAAKFFGPWTKEGKTSPRKGLMKSPNNPQELVDRVPPVANSKKGPFPKLAGAAAPEDAQMPVTATAAAATAANAGDIVGATSVQFESYESKRYTEDPRFTESRYNVRIWSTAWTLCLLTVYPC